MSHDSGHHGGSDCPFMLQEDSICSMTLFDHVGAWSTLFLTDLIKILIFVLVAVFVYEQIYIKSLRRPQRHRSVVRSILDILYADGILNPKIF